MFFMLILATIAFVALILILSTVFRLFIESLRYLDCHDKDSLQFNNRADREKGLAVCLELRCSSCLYAQQFFLSKETARKEKGKGKNKYK